MTLIADRLIKYEADTQFPDRPVKSHNQQSKRKLGVFEVFYNASFIAEQLSQF